MTFLHTFFAQSYHQREVRLKLIHFSFNLVANSHNLLQSFFFEDPDHSDKASNGLLHELLGCVCVEILEGLVEPPVNIRIPFVDDVPKGVVGCELFDDNLQPRVVSLILCEQLLARIELACQLSEGVELGHNLFAHLYSRFVDIDVAVLVEGKDMAFNGIEALFILCLFLIELFLVLIILPVDLFNPFFHHGVGILWLPEHTPTVLHLNWFQPIFLLFQDIVYLCVLVNLHSQLLNFGCACSLEEFLELRGLLDVSSGFIDLLLNSFEMFQLGVRNGSYPIGNDLG